MPASTQSAPDSTRRARFSPTLLFVALVLGTVLLIACNPFSGDDEAAQSEDSNAELVNVALEEPQTETGESAGSGDAGVAADNTPPAEDPATPASEASPPPTEAAPAEVPAAAPSGTGDEARSLVWAYLTQCVSLSVTDLEARQVQGEWFVQAAGELPDKYGLWKVEPATGTILPHNIRARQWGPLVNQSCTPELFSGFFTPTPSPLLNSDITEPGQAITTLWATLVNCYPNMSADDLQATLDSAKGAWVVTARPGVTANYGVWSVAGDGTVAPKNRQAQGVFDQLDSGLC